MPHGKYVCFPQYFCGAQVFLISPVGKPVTRLFLADKHSIVLPALMLLREANIRNMNEAGTVIVSRVSSNMISFLLITSLALSTSKAASSFVGIQIFTS